jgi:hypothetical protein
MENKKIFLSNVRLSFPSLWVRSIFDGKEGKYEATFLIPKSDTETKNKMDTTIRQMIAESKLKIPKDKICVKDGDDYEFDGYENTWTLKASNNRQPTLLDTDKTPLTTDDGKIYAGCYVNAVIEFWVQNNNYGKRINANLLGVQFVKHGEAFGTGAGTVNCDEMFNVLPSAEVDKSTGVDTSAVNDLGDDIPF